MTEYGEKDTARPSPRIPQYLNNGVIEDSAERSLDIPQLSIAEEVKALPCHWAILMFRRGKWDVS